MNFSSEIEKLKKSRTINIKEQTLQGCQVERNVIAEVLRIAIDKNIDLDYLFSFPLTNVPHSLSHIDGTPNLISNKTDILLILENQVKQMRTGTVNDAISGDVEIIDGFGFLESLGDAPLKYGGFAEFVLKKICNTSAYEIHIIFAKYSPEQHIRNYECFKKFELFDDDTIYKINGPNQERQSALSKCLCSNNFRHQIVTFFLQHWKEDNIIVPGILKNKRVFISYGGECFCLLNVFDSLHDEIQEGLQNRLLSVPNMKNNHIEVESQMILHVFKTDSQSSVIIKTQHPDVILIYVLYHMNFMNNGKEIWIESGSFQNNSSRKVNVREIFNKLGKKLTLSLPGWFAFTGCSYEPSFFGKGRKTCYKLLANNEDFQNAFINLGCSETEANRIDSLEHFTCKMYTSTEVNVNSARAQIFLEKDGTFLNIPIQLIC